MRRILILLLAAGFIAVSTVGCAGTGVTPDAGAAAGPDVLDKTPDNVLDETLDDDTEMLIDDGSDIIFDDIHIVLPGEGGDFYTDEPVAFYFSVAGVVVSIEEIDGYIHVTIDDIDGNPAILVLSEETLFLFARDIEIGDTVTGWYRTDMPMMMIWPPQYNIAVLAVGAPEDVIIRVDRFHTWEESTEGYLLSQDGMFAFNIDENTEIILADGLDFSDGELDGRRIVVMYDISTRSLPELTTARKLIVLFEDIMPIG